MRILFIHGFASSGSYKAADALRILCRPCEVLAPDVPIDPHQALQLLTRSCRDFRPDVVVGLSLGGFWAQKLRGMPKVLINPDLHVSTFLRTRLGTNTYLSPRQNADTTFEVTAAQCDAYHALELTEYDSLDEAEINRTVGMFATHDELIHCHDVFAAHYPGQAFWYPGTHLPNFGELRQHILPHIMQLTSALR